MKKRGWDIAGVVIATLAMIAGCTYVLTKIEFPRALFLMAVIATGYSLVLVAYIFKSL